VGIILGVITWVIGFIVAVSVIDKFFSGKCHAAAIFNFKNAVVSTVESYTVGGCTR